MSKPRHPVCPYCKSDEHTKQIEVRLGEPPYSFEWVCDQCMKFIDVEEVAND